jgi:hypothetical protein
MKAKALAGWTASLLVMFAAGFVVRGVLQPSIGDDCEVDVRPGGTTQLPDVEMGFNADGTIDLRSFEAGQVVDARAPVPLPENGRSFPWPKDVEAEVDAPGNTVTVDDKPATVAQRSYDGAGVRALIEVRDKALVVLLPAGSGVFRGFTITTP